MDMYWSLIFAVAGVGAAVVIALVVAAALVLGLWFAASTLIRRRWPDAPSAAPTPRVASAPGKAAGHAATQSRTGAAPRPRTGARLTNS